MDVSIVVVSYNTRDLLASCLRSVHGGAELKVEIIVVDNASADGSAEMVASDFPGVRLIRNPENLGFAGANNQAIRISGGRYVLLLNSDAVLVPGSLRALVEFMDGHPEAAIVGAQLLNPDGSFQCSYADFPSLKSELLLATKLARLVYPTTYPSYPAHQSQQVRAVDWVSGACLMARRAAVDAVGLLDEDYFMYTEETDWCYRMRQNGWLVFYLPEARALHWAGQSASKVPERKRMQLYHSKYLFFRKHRGWLATAAFSGALRVVSGLKLALWAIRSLRRDRARRELALQHLQSYRLLLGKL